jgi:hypothetical protein
MCAFTSDFDRARAGYSPDRLDALVWGFRSNKLRPESPGSNATSLGFDCARDEVSHSTV